MSFEQAAGMRSDELDARSDIYSLGVVVYEMLTGRVPFHSDTPLGCVRKHLTEQPPPFRAVKPDLPALPQLERVVLKALRKDRDERCASALEFARELAEAAGGTQPTVPLPQTRVVPPEAPAPTPAPPVLPQAVAPSLPKRAAAPPPQLRPTPARPSRAKYVIFAFLVLAAAGTGMWYWWQSRLQPQVELKPPSESGAKTPAPPAGMIYIPGGTFMMGRGNAEDPEETPAHTVTVTPFYLDKTPVTFKEYDQSIDRLAQRYGGKAVGRGTSVKGDIFDRVAADALPVTNVTWREAQAYCEEKGKRLPTEAEWEFAARGTDGRLYPWGYRFESALTNSVEAGSGRTEAVGLRPGNASPFGVLDMSGNVWEWTADDYRPYPGRQSDFPAGAKAIRGGSFQCDKDHVTTTTRNLDLPTTRSPTIGFRCAKSM
jgi:serine/threonine-protein kinase